MSAQSELRSELAPSLADALVGRDLAWMASSACKGRHDLFFASHGERPPARARRELAGRELCEGCPVRRACRNHARTWGEYGVWGGESEDEREEAGYLVSVAVNRRARRRRHLTPGG